MDKALADSADYFVTLAEIKNGQKAKEIGATAGTSPVGQGTQNLVKAAEGDFTVGKMLIDFETNRDSDTKLDIAVQPGKGCRRRIF